jgi:hypothetical protein
LFFSKIHIYLIAKIRKQVAFAFVKKTICRNNRLHHIIFSLVLEQISYMRRINPKYIRIAGITALILVVIMLIGGYVAYSKREVLLQKAITKLKQKQRGIII